MADPPLPPLPPLPDDDTATVERAARPEPPPPPSASRRRSKDEPESPRRRQWSAGHALVVCVLALAIGLMLNAPGIHKSDYNKSAGWEREMALAFTGPLADVSHALLLDRPRKGVQALIGRSDDDEIDTEIALPAPGAPITTPPISKSPGTSPPRTPAKPKPPRKVAFSPQKKLRLWVAGDSLVITPGYAVVRAAGSSPAIESVGGVDGRVATGLTRPDGFNWFEQITTRV